MLRCWPASAVPRGRSTRWERFVPCNIGSRSSTLYPGDEFGPGASTEIAAAVARRAVEAGYEAVIRKQVGHTVDDITVQRDYQRIHVTITVATSMSALNIHRLVDRVRQAVRSHDAHTETVDISVVRTDPAVD